VPTQPPAQIVLGLSQGWSSLDVVIAAHLLLAPRLRMVWNCTSGSLLLLYGHVTRWPLPLPYIDHSRFCCQTSTKNGFQASFIRWLSLTGTNHISCAWMKFDRILKNKLSYTRSVKATQEEQDEIGGMKIIFAVVLPASYPSQSLVIY